MAACALPLPLVGERRGRRIPSRGEGLDLSSGIVACEDTATQRGRERTYKLGPDIVLGQREVQEPVPVRGYLLSHRLIVGAVLASHFRRLCVASPLRQAL